MRRPLLPTALHFCFCFFCCAFFFLSGALAYGAPKAKQPSSTGLKNPSTRANMAQVERVLKARIAASVFVLQVLERKAQRTQQSVPLASGMLDAFRSWLALKTTKNAHAGGLYPKLDRAYSSLKARGDAAALQESLGGHPSGESVKAVLAQQIGQSRALIETKSAHDDTLKYRKAADEKLHLAAEELWRRGEKAQSGELERFRRAMAADMGEAARWLEEGLKAHALALEGYYAAAVMESVGGLQKLALAAAEPASCPRGQIDFHEGQIAQAKKRQDYWKTKLSDDQAACSAGRVSATVCKQFIDGDNSWIKTEQETIDSHAREKERLEKLCVSPPKPPIVDDKKRIEDQKADLTKIMDTRDLQFTQIGQINSKLSKLGMKQLDITKSGGAAKALEDQFKAKDEGCKAITDKNRAICANWKKGDPGLRNDLAALKKLSGDIAALQIKIQSRKPETPAPKVNIATLIGKPLGPLGENLIKYHETGGTGKAALNQYFDGCKKENPMCGVGNLTIGFGHKVTDSEKLNGIVIGKTTIKNGKITDTQAENLFKQDVDRKTAELKGIIGAPNGISKDVKLTQNQYGALLGLVFNTGAGNIKKNTGGILKTKFLKALNKEDEVAAGEEIVSFWKIGTVTKPGLVRRGADLKELWKAP